MTEEYLKIKEQHTLGDADAFDGLAVDIISMLQECVEKYGTELQVDYEIGYYDDDPEYVLHWTRKETDDERDIRLKAKRKERENAEKHLVKDTAKRYRQYLKLKKEFEK